MGQRNLFLSNTYCIDSVLTVSLLGYRYVHLAKGLRRASFSRIDLCPPSVHHSLVQARQQLVVQFHRQALHHEPHHRIYLFVLLLPSPSAILFAVPLLPFAPHSRHLPAFAYEADACPLAPVGSDRRARGLQGRAGVRRCLGVASWPCGGPRHAAVRPPTTATATQARSPNSRCDPIQYEHTCRECGRGTGEVLT